MVKKIEILPDTIALIDRAKELIVTKINQTLEKSDRVTIALSGGSTPKALYEKLAQEKLNWEKIHIFWGDERYVSPEHPDSNQRMAKLAWLDKVPIPAANIHPMPTSAGDASIDAAIHNQHIQEFFAIKTGEIPSFDIILLGMGDDAHTASLFPHTEALTICDRLITVGNKDGQPRLTFTVPLINKANNVIFLVAGANKQTALDKVFAPNADAMTYPSRLIQPEGELKWLLDYAASQNLKI